MRELLALPGDPTALKTWLLANYSGHSTESASDPMPADVWLFQVARTLLMGLPVKPAVRAATYRMLSTLKSIKVIASVTAPDGRTGTAITMTTNTKGGGVLQDRLIVQPLTGRAVAQETVVVKPDTAKGFGSTASFRPGTVMNYTTYRYAGWTNATPARRPFGIKRRTMAARSQSSASLGRS
jgi:hypothetical protein